MVGADRLSRGVANAEGGRGLYVGKAGEGHHERRVRLPTLTISKCLLAVPYILVAAYLASSPSSVLVEACCKGNT